MLIIPALLFGSGEVRAGRGYLGGRSPARSQGQSHQPGHPPRRSRFAGGRAFLFGFCGRVERPLRRFPFGLPLFLLQPRQVSAWRPASSQGPSAPARTSDEQSSAAVRSGERDTVGNAVGGCGTCDSVWGKEATLENPADPGVEPYPSAWLLPAPASIIAEPDAVRAVHNICCFGPPRWKEQCWAGFLPGLEALERRCCCKVPHVPLATKAATQAAATYPPQLCEEYAKLWLDAMTSRDAERNVPNSSASGGQQGSRVLRLNASVCQQPKSKKEDKEAENEPHVGGLRRPSQTLYLVPGWETTGRWLWDCINATLSDDTDASGLTRLYGQQSKSTRFKKRFRKSSLWDQS